MCYCFARQKRTSQCSQTYQSQITASKNGNSLTKHEDKQKSSCYSHLQAWPQRVFLHTLFLEYATETGGNKCKAVFYTYKQIGMPSLELFWPCSILAKNLRDVLARGLSISIVCFLQTRLFTEKFSRTGTIHPGIFCGRALFEQ